MKEFLSIAKFQSLKMSLQVRLRFKEIQRSKEKLTSHVTCEEFQEAYCELCTRPDVYFLLVQLSKDRECLDPQDLRLFLETEQGLSLVTTEGCWELLRRYEPSAQAREKGLLGLDGLTRYLQSAECHLFDPEHLEVCQDMTMPLSHYYIRYLNAPLPPKSCFCLEKIHRVNPLNEYLK